MDNKKGDSALSYVFLGWAVPSHPCNVSRAWLKGHWTHLHRLRLNQPRLQRDITQPGVRLRIEFMYGEWNTSKHQNDNEDGDTKTFGWDARWVRKNRRVRYDGFADITANTGIASHPFFSGSSVKRVVQNVQIVFNMLIARSNFFYTLSISYV